MHRTRVKICGVTRADDAAAAASAGADAVGMVFHAESRRCVTLARAAEIVAALPAMVTRVALFVNETPAVIRETARQLGIGTIQLHGEESPELIAELAPLRVIKAVGVRAESLSKELARWRDAIKRFNLANLAGLLMDSPAGAVPGGAGVANDFGALSRAVRDGAWSGLPPMIIAGGLTPSNVAAAVSLLRPWAVDVSSGVERIKGQKSAEKIVEFIEQVRLADQSADQTHAD